MKSIKKRIIALKDRLVYNIKRPEMRVLPGQLAFFFLLTLIPLVSLLGGLISLLDLPYSSISEVLNNYFQDGTANLLSAITTKPDLSANVIIFFASAILLASNGPHSMIVTSNQIYKIKDRNYIIRRAKALLMTIVVVILLVFVLLIPVFGDMIFKMIATIDSSSTIRNLLLSAYKILKYPFSFVFMYYMIKMLYIMAPDKRIERKNVIYGSLFTTICWILVTQIYSLYVEKFSNYTTLYGSMASILILMLWLYLISYIFVLGMALNVTKYELTKVNEKNSIESK